MIHDESAKSTTTNKVPLKVQTPKVKNLFLYIIKRIISTGDAGAEIN